MRIPGLSRRTIAAGAEVRPSGSAPTRQEPTIGGSAPATRAESSGGPTFSGLDDPALLEYIRQGSLGFTPGARALRNMAFLRCVCLISNSIGMLPLNLMESGPDKAVMTDHSSHRLVKRKPNDWQTPSELKSLLQIHALIHGNGYARVIWAGSRPIRLIPLNPLATEPRLTSSWQMVYDHTTPGGSQITLPAREVLHLRDLSLDGIKGISRVKLAGEAIALARMAEDAASRIFRTGVMAGGAIEMPNSMSDSAYNRVRDSLREDHSGAENAGSWFLLEEGAKANKFASTAEEGQQIENRNHQIEEMARLFGVPRPLLMMDDTSWGSGIEQLAIAFVQYTLAPWFKTWEEALARVLLSEAEMETLQFKFNERALLRGTVNDQANFFAKALGAGGQASWMTQEEVRELSDLPASNDPEARKLRGPLSQKGTNEPPKPT